MSYTTIPDGAKQMIVEQITRVCADAKPDSMINTAAIVKAMQEIIDHDDAGDEFKTGAFTLAMTLIMTAAANSGDETTMLKLSAILPQPQ